MLRNTLNTVITATLIMLLGVSSSASAQTIVPMGDLMGSTSVTFGDQTLEDKSAPVYVPLAPSAPEITLSEGDESGDWIIEVGQDTARSITYAVTATANGPDDYTLTAEYDEATSENVDSPTLSVSTSMADDSSLELGATAAISIADRAITVPYDKEGGLDSVNGISAEETVVIGGTPYPVASVTNSLNSEDPTADPTATILLGGDIPAPDIDVGTPITEQRTFTVTVSNVALAEEDEGAAGIKITATSVKDGLKKSEHSFKFVVLAPVEPSFEKYVRNVTAPVEIEAGETAEYGSEAYYTEGVSAEEGNVLEYLIVLNAGNQGEHTKIILNEALSPFVKYVSDSSKVDGKKLEDEPDATSPILIENWTVTDGSEEGLILPPDGSAHITYQVTVGGEETVPGGDGGDVDLPLTPEEIKLACNGDNPQLFSIETCKGQPWDARNGTTLEKNPVCWDTVKYGSGWQVDGKNPWVVGTGVEFNIEAYDCRTKCADKSGESFGHCAADGWWHNDAAKSTVCEFAGEQELGGAIEWWKRGGQGQRSTRWAGCGEA